MSTPVSENIPQLMTHDTPRNKAIAADNTILRVQVGSRLHGVIVDSEDDSDEMGLVIEPPEYVIQPPRHMTGWKRFDQYEHRTAPRGVRSGPGDTDLISYSLRKWAGLAASGNATVLLILFAPDEYVHDIKWPGHDLRARKEMFLSSLAGDAFLGYLDTQRDRMTGARSQKTNRPDLIAKYGYDTKFAFHALRLAYQGIELMRTGELILPIPEPTHSILLDVREGRIAEHAVISQIETMEKELQFLTDNGSGALPDLPDYDRINAWLADTYRQWWEQVN